MWSWPTLKSVTLPYSFEKWLNYYEIEVSGKIEFIRLFRCDKKKVQLNLNM